MLAAVALSLGGCGEEPPKPVEQIRSIKTVTVTEPASGQTRKYSGIVQATDTSFLSFQIGGNVQTVKVNLGDKVTKGQVLATLDQRSYALNVQAAGAELSKARAGLEQSKAEYARQKQLFEKGWVAKQRVDRVFRSFESAKSQVDYAIAKLNLAKRDVLHTKLKAPFNGIIAKKLVEPHMEVRAGQKLFEINAEGSLEVSFDIPETIIARITPGMPVSIAFPTAQNCACRGRITEVGSVAGRANAFPVKAALIDPPRTIRAGMTAEVTIVIKHDERGTAYLVPLAAIAPGDKPREGYVFIFDPTTGTVRRSLVKGRGATENMAQIYQGVDAGDIIAIAGVSFLTDGQKVKLMKP
jgi:RND family efflux transporter MFP subunit